MRSLICGPPPCTTTGFMPTRRISTTSCANRSASAGSSIAWPPYLMTTVAAGELPDVGQRLGEHRAPSRSDLPRRRPSRRAHVLVDVGVGEVGEQHRRLAVAVVRGRRRSRSRGRSMTAATAASSCRRRDAVAAHDDPVVRDRHTARDRTGRRSPRAPTAPGPSRGPCRRASTAPAGSTPPCRAARRASSRDRASPYRDPGQLGRALGVARHLLGEVGAHGRQRVGERVEADPPVRPIGRCRPRRSRARARCRSCSGSRRPRSASKLSGHRVLERAAAARRARPPRRW